MPRRLRSHVRILKYREWGVTISRKLPNKNITKIDYRQAWRTALVRQDVISAEKVFLFNCDNTYNLEIVERFLLEVEEKYGFKFSVDRLYFGLQRMAEVCDRIIPTLDMDVAVFVVYANESRLSMNEDNPGDGYARIYRALLKKTGGLQLSLNGSLSIA